MSTGITWERHRPPRTSCFAACAAWPTTRTPTSLWTRPGPGTRTCRRQSASSRRPAKCSRRSPSGRATSSRLWRPDEWLPSRRVFPNWRSWSSNIRRRTRKCWKWPSPIWEPSCEERKNRIFIKIPFFVALLQCRIEQISSRFRITKTFVQWQCYFVFEVLIFASKTVIFPSFFYRTVICDLGCRITRFKTSFFVSSKKSPF